MFQKTTQPLPCISHLLEMAEVNERADIITALNEGKHGLVFRKACNEKLYPLIEGMLNYHVELSINLNEKSSNGNTALDWFDNGITSEVTAVHKELRAKLCNQGAVNGKLKAFEKADALLLGTDELATAFPNSDYPVIGTLGAGQCLILGVYDTKQHKVLVSHITGLNGKSAKMNKTLSDELDKFLPNSSVAYILGGLKLSAGNSPYSEATYLILKQMLFRKGIRIEHSDVFRAQNNPASLAIDARNGKCYFNVDIGNFTREAFDRMVLADPPLGEIAIAENVKIRQNMELKI